jgi:hypothetical protein
MVSRMGRTGLGVACWAALGCGASPSLKSTADYRPEALTPGRVLFVPLAVSEPLGDKRTGIILSDETRALASDSACRRLTESWSEPSVVCIEGERGAADSAFGQVQLLFALDQPIPNDLWRELRKTSRATHAILFRPEAVSSSREVSQDTRLGSPIMMIGTGGLLATTTLVSGLLAGSTAHTVTLNETELSYTVSASLVDLQTGKLLRVGVHSGRASREVRRNLGFAEPPPAAPILEGVMVELGEAVLDD